MHQCPARNQWLRWVGAVGVLIMLTGCAVLEWQKPGTPAAAIIANFGDPVARVDIEGGGQRWVYSRQPAGQQVFHLTLDAQQHLLRVEQVLNEAVFAQLKPGIDHRQSVFNYFGQPALVEGVGNFTGDIWTYRIYENSMNRQAHVFIDPQGIVQRVMFTDELRNDDDPGDRK